MSQKVLVIDDEDDVIVFLTTVLKKHGYETAVAKDGQEGIEVARKSKPDLIVLDLVMPKQSGADFVRNLRKDSALAKVPIIVVSGAAGRNLFVKDPVAVFDKPIDPDAFIGAVAKALGEAASRA